jgi:hypothetical protein
VSDILFNKKLKEDLKKYKLTVAEDFSQCINNTLESLPERKVKRSMKPTIAAAALVMITLLGVGTVYPVNAEKIPVIGYMFNLVLKNGLVPKEYNKFAEDVNQSITHGEVTITLENVAADENMVVLTNLIKSKSKIQWENYLQMGEAVKIKGLDVYDFSRSGVMIDDYSYYAIYKIDLKSEARIPTNFKMDFSIKDIKGINESFDFKLKVDREKALKETKIFKIDAPIKYSGGEYNINKVILTPLSTKIQGIGNSELTSVFLFDDKGNEIRQEGRSSYSQKANDVSDKFINIWNIDAEKINKDTKYIKIVPYVKLNGWYYDNAEKVICSDYSNLPVTLNQGSIGSIKINNINYEDDLMIMNYEVEGKIPYEQAYYLFLVDEQENIVQQVNSYSMSNIAIFKVDREKKYKITTINLDKAYRIFDDETAILELK